MAKICLLKKIQIKTNPDKATYNFLKYKPSKHLLVLKTSSTRLQRKNFTPSKTSWRRLEDILEDEKLLRWRFLEDVLKTCLEAPPIWMHLNIYRKCASPVFTFLQSAAYWHSKIEKRKKFYWVNFFNQISKFVRFFTNFVDFEHFQGKIMSQRSNHKSKK